MALTLLQIIQSAQAELGLPVSTTVAGNADRTTVQMFALSNRVLDELRRMNRWTAMQFEYDLAVTPATSTTGDTTANSPVITNIPSTAGLVAQAFAINGANIPTAARIQSVDSPTQVTMTMEATGTVVGGSIQFGQDTYPVPTDFDWFNNQTMWDRTNHWSLLGPDSPQTDQWHRSGIFTTGPRRHFRKVGPYFDNFRLWPPPFEITNPIQLVFEYLSLNAVSVSGSSSVFAQFFVNDNDQPLLDAQAIILGLKWLFWQAKGFNYAAMQAQWLDYCERLKARDGAAKTLSMVRRPDPYLISSASVQDGDWPGQGNP